MIDWLERAIFLLDKVLEDHASNPANPEECANCYAEYYPCTTTKQVSKALVILREIRSVWIAGTSGEKHV